MTRPLLAFSSALALLALPGCTEVLVPDGPTEGLFGVYQFSPNEFGQWATFSKRVLSVNGGVEEIDRDGTCTLYRYAPPPVSGPTSPLAVDAGELRVTGGLEDLVMDFEDG